MLQPILILFFLVLVSGCSSILDDSDSSDTAPLPGNDPIYLSWAYPTMFENGALLQPDLDLSVK